MNLSPPHRAVFGREHRSEKRTHTDDTKPGTAHDDAASGAIADVIRVTLLNDAIRQDRREDLAFQARARRMAFLAQAVAEITPPPPMAASHLDPQARADIARYRTLLQPAVEDMEIQRGPRHTDLTA